MTVTLAKSIGLGAILAPEAVGGGGSGSGGNTDVDPLVGSVDERREATTHDGAAVDTHAIEETPFSTNSTRAQCLPYAADDFPSASSTTAPLDFTSSSAFTDPQRSSQSNKQQQQQHSEDAVAHGGHHGHKHGHGEPANLPFYAAPHQRQRWGDTQVAPHTNWGDIFFDLFYVAAAYNLGTVLSTDPTPMGLLYTVVLFMPIQNLWFFKTYYDSRFYYHDDLFHRGYEIAILVALATAVLHIKPITILSQPALYQDMFVYGVGLSVAFFLSIFRLAEIMICQRSSSANHSSGLHPEAYHAARYDFWSYLGTGLFYTASAFYAGWKFYQPTSATTYDDSHVDDGSDEDHRTAYMRLLAGDATTSIEKTAYDEPLATDHTAAWILLAAIVKSLLSYVVRLCIKMTSKTDTKARTVPINVDFSIHRYGEWVMLMLGESVLSLLVVDIAHTTRYYLAFLGGIVSIIMGQYLHFQSAPSDPDQHAIRRSVGSSFLFYWIFQVFSLAMIILGVSYKMSLVEIVSEETKKHENVYRRSLLFHGGDGGTSRLLAGAVNPALGLSTIEKQQHIAHLFSGSLSVIFFCSDAMSLTHRGIRTQIKRCECANTRLKRFLLVVLVTCRLVAFVFVAMLSQFVTDPGQVVAIGTFTITAQVGIRLLGSYVFHDEEEREQKAMERAINYTQARIHDRPEYSDSVRLSGLLDVK